MNDAQVASRLWILAVVVVVVWLAEKIVPVLQSIGDILFLFFLAWLVAFVLEPLVARLERLHLGRGLSVAVVYLALILFLVSVGVLVFPPLIAQLGDLRENLPRLVAQLPAEDQMASFLTGIGLPAGMLSAIYRPDALAQQLQTLAGTVLQGAIAVATSTLTVLVNTLLLLVISFYILLEGRGAIRDILRLVPHQHREDALFFLDQVSANFGGFLRGQVVQALLFGTFAALLMLITGLEFVAVTTLASTLLMLIPLVGPIMALLPPLVVALFHSPGLVLATAMSLVAAQAIIINMMMPRILSQHMGLPPLFVFLAILLGLRMGGPLGAFFGIPIMGVIYGMANALLERWKISNDARRQEDKAVPQSEGTRTTSA